MQFSFSMENTTGNKVTSFSNFATNLTILAQNE